MSVVPELVRKELLLLSRDWHALALLFVMPAFFILLMSLAMRDLFTPGRNGGYAYFLVNSDSSVAARTVADRLRKRDAFRELAATSDSGRTQALRAGKASFAVVIPRGFGAALADSQPRALTVISGPSVNAAASQLFTASVREAVSGVYVDARIAAMMLMLGADDGSPGAGAGTDNLPRLIVEQTVYRDAIGKRRPTSVQQNVPAWLVFAMFFVALPLSTTWLQERTQGTLTKLRSVGISSSALLVGKLLPYVVVNLVQVAVMLAVGLWAVPALGGDALTLGHSPVGLFVMALAVAAASVSYALLVANLVRTTEQATIVTGATNLLLGALGGVMVPRSVMPEALQHLSFVSPMAWGVDGFLDILLRDGTLRTIAPDALLLLALALTALALAGLRLHRGRTS